MEEQLTIESELVGGDSLEILAEFEMLGMEF